MLYILQIVRPPDWSHFQKGFVKFQEMELRLKKFKRKNTLKASPSWARRRLLCMSERSTPMRNWPIAAPHSKLQSITAISCLLYVLIMCTRVRDECKSALCVRFLWSPCYLGGPPPAAQAVWATEKAADIVCIHLFFVSSDIFKCPRPVCGTQGQEFL